MDKAKEFILRRVYKIFNLPRSIQIEVTNRCNLDCQMCPRKSIGVPDEDMPFGIFQAAVDKLMGAREVILTGWGEPFLHQDIFTMIMYCKLKKFKVKVTTNGLPLKPEDLEMIISYGLDEITFSVDSLSDNIFAHKNTPALRNIEQLIPKRKDRIPRIAIQTTLHEGRAEDVYDIIRWAGRTGVDQVNLVRLDTRFNPNLKRPSSQEEKRILKEAEAIGRRTKVSIQFIPYAQFSGFKRLLYKIMLRLTPAWLGCPKPYRQCYINCKGELTPCCNLPSYKICLAEEFTSIQDVWNNNTFWNFRDNQQMICSGCDVLKIAR